MRKHEIRCNVIGDTGEKDMQNHTNHFTALYLENTICKSGFSKEEQLKIVEELLKKYKDAQPETNQTLT